MGSQSSLVLIRGVDRLIQKYCVGVRKRARSALDPLERSKSFRAAQKLTLVSQVLRAPPITSNFFGDRQSFERWNSNKALIQNDDTEVDDGKELLRSYEGVSDRYELKHLLTNQHVSSTNHDSTSFCPVPTKTWLLDRY